MGQSSLKNVIRPLLIDDGLSDSIKRFVKDEGKLFKTNPAGLGRKFCNLNKLDHELSKQVREFSEHCYNTLGLVPSEEEHLYGNFIGVNSGGAFVHTHTDPRKTDKIHVRLNFLIQKPNGGGMPVIDGITYTVEQGQCWINLASEWKHGSTPVVGSTPRIVLSLGRYVDRKLLED
jgi:hypothetical protein